MQKMLTLLTVVLFSSGRALCNQKDRQIFDQKGNTFSAVFRSYGGMFVTQAEYEQTIVSRMGLSDSCARCYGQAYTCGYDHCKMACAWAGTACDRCLETNRCTQECNQCTGFIV